MIDKNTLGATFTGQLHQVRTVADGGGRMQIDFGRDSLKEVQLIQELAALGRVNFQIAFVVLPEGNPKYQEPDASVESEESVEGDW